ncbi:MAG: TetR/AcrR family transcriptional regulator [Cyanobacteria bacterium SZAS LIN-3]|nr:TetR/AcrR family transcriptional regulator [Cyanobacteria bacterium SZAS LIN-3]
MTRGVRKGLSKEVILKAAFKIVESGGVETLSMRRLGSELGVAAMAIYNHFPDREQLLDAMAESALAEITPDEQKGNWKKQVTNVARSVANLSIEKPAVFALCMSRPTKPKAAVVLMSKVLEALRQGGLSDKEALACYHSVLILLHGFPFWQAGLTKYCAASPDSIATADLSEQEKRDWKLLHTVDPAKQFEASLALLLDGY